MDDKLVEQLLDAKFPLKFGGLYMGAVKYAFPTLSSLIDACGDGFAELSKGDSQVDYPWTASGFPIKLGFCGNGKTPEESVAKLWLELNK